MRKLRPEDKKIPTSVSFERSMLDRIENVKGYMSRSAWINTVLDNELKKQEQKMELA